MQVNFIGSQGLTVPNRFLQCIYNQPGKIMHAVLKLLLLSSVGYYSSLADSGSVIAFR